MVTKQQFLAVKKAVELGRIIQKDIPEVAEDYIGGETLAQIVKKYNICSRYSVGTDIGIFSVCRAIRGYQSKSILDSYSGLIQDKEKLDKLCLEHKLKGAQNSVIRRGKKPWAKREYKNLFTKLSEAEFAYKLSLCHENQKYKGHPNLKSIANSLNKLYHKGKKIRTTDAVYNALSEYKKKFKKK